VLERMRQFLAFWLLSVFVLAATLPANAQLPASPPDAVTNEKAPAAGDGAATAADTPNPEQPSEKAQKKAEKPEEEPVKEPLTEPFLAAPEPHVPSFWDPQTPVEKPAKRIVAIRFLTSPGFPPFNFIAPDGRLSGFNVDLARAICEALEAECTIQLRKFEDLQTALEDNRGDAIVAGIDITAESRKTLAFSDVYLRLPGRFIAKQDSGLEATPEGLDGKWISAVIGTAHEAYLHRYFTKSRIATYQTPARARAALQSGDVDVHFGDGMSLGFWLAGTEANGCCSFIGGPFSDTAFFGKGFAVAMAPDNARLRNAINYALRRIYDSGRYEELYLRYFPVSFY